MKIYFLLTLTISCNVIAQQKIHNSYYEEYSGNNIEKAFMTEEELLEQLIQKKEIRKNRSTQNQENTNLTNQNVEKKPQLSPNGAPNLSSPCNEPRSGPSINNGTRINCLREFSNKNRASVNSTPINIDKKSRELPINNNKSNSYDQN